jgi:hypothetical protein
MEFSFFEWCAFLQKWTGRIFLRLLRQLCGTKGAHFLSPVYLSNVFPKNLTYTRAGFEPWSSVPGADSISIAPRRQGKLWRTTWRDTNFHCLYVCTCMFSIISEAACSPIYVHTQDRCRLIWHPIYKDKLIIRCDVGFEIYVSTFSGRR